MKHLFNSKLKINAIYNYINTKNHIIRIYNLKYNIYIILFILFNLNLVK